MPQKFKIIKKNLDLVINAIKTLVFTLNYAQTGVPV